MYTPLLLLILALPFVIVLSQRKQQVQQFAAGTGKFQITGTKIYDPNGNQFIVKGIESVHEYFNGDNGNGQINYNNYKRDLDAEKALGANFIRIFVSADVALNPNNADGQHFFGGSTATFFQQLDTVVNYATQTDGLVVELTESSTNDVTEVNTFLGQEAARYKNNPYVWIETMNEINCLYGNTANCQNWSAWQSQQNTFISTIRNNGFTNPIVINSIDWSNDMRQIGSYPLTDTAHNFIYGVHRYADSTTSLSTSYESTYWSSLATSYPMFIDEIGIWDLGTYYQPTWTQQFLDYAAQLTNSGTLNGVNGFVWFGAGASVNGTYYSDAMEGDPSTHTSNNVLNSWGSMYQTHYLSKVQGTIILTQTPQPTANTPTATPTIMPITPTPTTTSSPQISRDAQRKADLQTITNALVAYYQVNHKYPQAGSCAYGTNCYAYSTAGASWIPALVPQYIAKLPVDPINNRIGPWNQGNYSYAYGNVSKDGQIYDLFTQLENTSDPERCGLKDYIGFKGLNDPSPWCTAFGGAYSNQIYQVYPPTTTAQTVTPTPKPLPTATTAPINSGYIIYNDAIPSGWYDWSWSGGTNFANTSPVYSGSYSIRFNPSSGYAGFSIHSNTPINTIPYNYVTFAMQATQPSQQYSITLQDSNGNLIKPLVDLGNYGGYPVVGSWKVYTIPLTDLHANATTVTGFTVQTNSNTPPVFYLDSIQLR